MIVSGPPSSASGCAENLALLADALRCCHATADQLTRAQDGHAGEGSFADGLDDADTRRFVAVAYLADRFLIGTQDLLVSLSYMLQDPNLIVGPQTVARAAVEAAARAWWIYSAGSLTAMAERSDMEHAFSQHEDQRTRTALAVLNNAQLQEPPLPHAQRRITSTDLWCKFFDQSEIAFDMGESAFRAFSASTHVTIGSVERGLGAESSTRSELPAVVAALAFLSAMNTKCDVVGWRDEWDGLSQSIADDLTTALQHVKEIHVE